MKFTCIFFPLIAVGAVTASIISDLDVLNRIKEDDVLRDTLIRVLEVREGPKGEKEMSWYARVSVPTLTVQTRPNLFSSTTKESLEVLIKQLLHDFDVRFNKWGVDHHTFETRVKLDEVPIDQLREAVRYITEA